MIFKKLISDIITYFLLPANIYLFLYSQLVLDGLVSFLEVTLGDSLDKSGQAAWKKLIGNIINGIEQDLEVLKLNIENEGE